MSLELQTEDRGRPSGPDGTAAGSGPRDRGRPNVSGDLPSVFQAAPMFGRAVAGYDRFQVDTYVQWAEDELATADREREHLLDRQHRTQAALDEARRLLAHSPAGGEFLGLSRRIGSMLAAAADDAEGMRAEAEADRSAARAQSERMVADAERLLADAEADAGRVRADAATAAEELTAEAGRILQRAGQDAERAVREARAEAAERIQQVRVREHRAAEHAAEIRRLAVAEASAARLQARDEIVRMLGAGREERRRADAEAAATRARLDREAASRRAAVLAEIRALEHQRSVLVAEVGRQTGPVTAPAGDRLEVPLRRLGERLRWRSGSVRAH